jgi:predicted RecB family nuclease
LGEFFYEPVIVLGSNQIAKENRLELAYLCFLLEKIQNKFPEKGLIIDKKGGKHRVELTKLKKSLKSIISEIQSFDQTPPKLILNRHCSQCSFENTCKTLAQKEDNLSLLDRITPKQVNKLEKKGIFTVKQLSFIYKPRRLNIKAKNPPILYKPEIQALAIHTAKTYIQRLPALDRKPIEIFLDIEGLPDDGFFYLFGILISENTIQKTHSFWADTQKNEKTIWQGVVTLLESYADIPIYHYGTFEPSAFEKLAKRYQTEIDGIKKRFVNINSFIYGKIYFPTYSNGLKDLGKSLGAKWANDKASGLLTIIWRNEWEEGQTQRKADLQTYNHEDCLALKILTDELSRIQTSASISNDVEFIQNPKKIASEISQGVHNQFELVLELAHNAYNGKKIKLDLIANKIVSTTKKELIKTDRKWLGKKIGHPNKSVFFAPDRYCIKHTEQKLNKSKIESKKIIIDLVFSKNGVKKNIIEYIGRHGYCPICNNSLAALSFRQISRQLYSHNFKSWIVFQRIEIQLSFSKINESLFGLINDKTSHAAGIAFIKDFSKYYEETENLIIQNVLSSPFIHADETTISILGENQYVWIFTTGKYVTYKFSKNREAITAKDFLKGYKGILITDFYAGYDSVECIQQKCWVHLIRDLNNHLWSNPFDKEFENLVFKIRNLIIPIINACNLHGLKKKYLSKYQKQVDEFYKTTIYDKVYKSELCILYQKRFERYKESLFIFISNDDISWHNNTAENGIRHICVQRKISGSFGGNQFPHYLRLVSIMQTCKFQNKPFLKFLLSKEKNIDNFAIRRKKVSEND